MSAFRRPRRRASAPPPSGRGEVVPRVEVGEIIDSLSADGVGGLERGRLLGRLAAALLDGARAAGARAALTGSTLVTAVAELAPHVQVRDLATLREHHGGLTGDPLAEALVAAASRVTAGIGAAGGALAAAQLAAPPTMLAAPVQVAAETLAVVLVELKLVAELHVVSGLVPAGGPAQQAAVYVQSWVARRGLDLGAGDAAPPAVSAVVATAARQQLRGRLVRRFGRNLSTMAPFLAGAVAGAELNRRETRALGDALREDLRRHLPRSR